MKKNLLNLGSLIENGLGGINPGFLCLIYTYLLQEFSLDVYRFIVINQIGIELDEIVMIDKKDVHINIRYPDNKNFIPKDAKEGKRLCLDIIHEALLRLAKQDKRIDINKLETIKNLVIKKNFSFYLVYKKYINPGNNSLLGSIVIHPNENSFDFYVIVEQDGKEICRLLVYKGKSTDYYIDDLFYYGKWKALNEFIIKGKTSEIEYHIYIDTCNVELVNISPNKDKAPIFNLFKAVPEPGALQDYIASLPPAIAAVISYEAN